MGACPGTYHKFRHGLLPKCSLWNSEYSTVNNVGFPNRVICNKLVNSTRHSSLLKHHCRSHDIWGNMWGKSHHLGDLVIVQVKNFILFGDIHKSIYFLCWREDGAQLTLLAKDFGSLDCYTTEFLIDGTTLSLLVSDSRQNLQVVFCHLCLYCRFTLCLTDLNPIFWGQVAVKFLLHVLCTLLPFRHTM